MVWVVAELIGSIISIVKSSAYSYYSSLGMYFRNSMEDLLQVLGTIIVPVIIVALLSGILYLLMKNKKKDFLTILTTVMIAEIPLVIASVLSLFSYIGSEIAIIIRAIQTLCYFLNAVLLYFAIKHLCEE